MIIDSICCSRLYKSVASLVRSNRFLLSLCLPVYLYLIRVFAQDVLLKYVIARVKQGDVVYDVGAFTGTYSIAVAQKRRQATIYAFEPNPAAYQELVRNVRRQRLEDRVIPINIALSNSQGSARFHISDYAPLSSLHMSHASFHDRAHIAGTVDVNCNTIDIMVQNGSVRPPHLIKVDTEGHELQVISGALKTIEEFQPSIGFETHGLPHEQKDMADTIISLLKPFGYNCRRLQAQRYTVWCQRQSF